MNPILLGRQVERGLKDLVRSTLNTTSPAFEGTVESFLGVPANFIKGPWISVALPFQQTVAPGEPFEEYFSEVPLGFAPYQHQLTAFERLGGTGPRSTLIATGTGSGKTEAYLWPILDHCRINKGRPGIKAILIYPMNALATDQARRIARAINTIPALSGVRAGIYADAEPRSPTDAMTEQEVITRRATMRSDPPDILLTNYKMLDYLLLRGSDQPLWAKNLSETLRFLVVDEMHTFDGAQGADLALLIRRLKHRLATPGNHLVCIGSSATLGGGEEFASELRAYASTIFGESFDADAVIREKRKASDEVFRPPEYFDWPAEGEVAGALESAMDMTQAETAHRLALCLFPSRSDPEASELHDGDPATVEWRLLLGRLLLEHVAAQRVLRIVADAAGPVDLGAIGESLGTIKALVGWSAEGRLCLAELTVSLISWARSGSRTSPLPLFGVRIQTWVREMSRMVASLPGQSPDGERGKIELLHANDLDERHLKEVLPVVNCTRCGTAAHLGRWPARGASLWAPLEDLYADFFDGGSNRMRLIYHESVSRKAGTSGKGIVVKGRVDAEGLTFKPGDHGDPEAGAGSPVWLYDPTDANGYVDRTCPACGHAHGLLLFGLRSSRLTAALANTLYASGHNEEDPEAKPRFLMFSDSVQDAAHRAAVAEIRNTGSVVRKSLHRAIAASPSQEMPLTDVIARVPEALRQDLGDEAFVATFIARSQEWREPYQHLLRSDRLPPDPRFLDHVTLRLGWEYFSDLTYRSHTSQTLEATGVAVAEVSPDRIRSVAETLPRHLANALSGSFAMDEATAARFLAGLLQQMRRRGAVGHQYVAAGMATAPPRIGGPNYFAASRAMGLGRMDTLPIPNHRFAAAPLPPTLMTSVQGYEPFLRDHSTNWYRDWADKFFIPISAVLVSQYDIIFQTTMRWLEADGVVHRIDRPQPSHEHGYVIEPEAVIASDRIVRLQCDTCRRREIALADNPWVAGSPCTRIACPGTLSEIRSEPAPAASGLLTTDRNHRVVAREHTGILEADERREIERDFIAKETPWAPNLISATPTLEMGIDIGDLSTLLLSSVPPEEANYVQRIGRSGRRDGNSLNLTIATARAHDLQFWEEPDSMLSGQVRPPGVYIEALSVLLRQVAAFSLDSFVAAGGLAGDYGKVRGVLRLLEGDRGDGFPLDWFRYLNDHGQELAGAFLAFLPPAVGGRQEIADRIVDYLSAPDDRSLIWHIRTIFDEAARDRAELVARRQELDNEAKRVRRRQAEMTPEELQKRLDEIKRDKGEINHAIRQGIDDVSVLRFLTDKGALPNYAFPEVGVKLKSIVARQTEDGRRQENGDNLVMHEYVRPASSALSEFAPGQYFYANGREVEIDRLELSPQDLTIWRFCQRCSHVENQATAEASSTCPRCDDDMWDDRGSTHEAVELKAVIAVTSEQKAAIRDADDRQQRQYDRAMLPFYGPATIETSWYAEGGDGSAPFGYEFIAPCEFRDFNFGQRASAPIGPKIAGQERSSRPFPICRHCGIVQRRAGGEDEAGKHQPRCRVLRDEGDVSRDAWEAKVFLMRKFQTESIRIIVPVAGEATHGDIKSFVAAINLGMRRHFAGKVDHIRSTVVEAQLDGLATVRSLFLYDAVPGGSGYLRQLAEHPDAMRAVVEKAAEALRTCPCLEDPKRTGCFRCVKSYRSQFGPGEPDRDTALRMMEGILAQWENLSRADEGIDTRIQQFLVDSKLEYLFLATLEKHFGAGCISPRVLEGGRKGFLLKVTQGERSHFWTIETQVQIDRRFRDVPRKRVDFLLSPVGGLKAKPIVVEMDGLKYHADTVADDLTIRLLLIRSGHARVWTLGWHDLEPNPNAQVPNPVSTQRLGTEHAGFLGRVMARPDLADLMPDVALMQDGSSLDGLLRHLADPGPELAVTASLLSRTIVGRGQEIGGLPRIVTVSDDGRGFLEEANTFGHANDRNLDLYLAVRMRPPGEWREVEDCRVLLRGTLPPVDGEPGLVPGYSDAWRGLWRLVNFMQDLPGFHVEFEGVDTLAAPDLTSVGKGPEDAAWLEVLTLVDEAFRPLVEALQAADAEPPDLVGADITENGEVVGMIEIGWSNAQVAICEDVFETSDWDLVPFDSERGRSLTEFVATILRKLEKVAA